MFIDFNTTRAFFNQHVPSGLLAVVALQLTGIEFFSCITVYVRLLGHESFCSSGCQESIVTVSGGFRVSL